MPRRHGSRPRAMERSGAGAHHGPEHDHRGEAPGSPRTRSRAGATATPGSPAAPGCSPSRSSTLDTLIDLESLGWPPLRASADGLEIAATCRIVELDRLQPRRPTGRRRRCSAQCCRSFLASFKIWNAATVGGNICMSLPAGPMISLTAALEGVCTLWPRDGGAAAGAGRRLRHRQPRERARAGRTAAQHRPARRGAARSASPSAASSLTHLGRSAVLLIGTRSPGRGDLLLTVTAATAAAGAAPLRARCPSADELRRAIDDEHPGRRATSTTCTARRPTAGT